MSESRPPKLRTLGERLAWAIRESGRSERSIATAAGISASSLNHACQPNRRQFLHAAAVARELRLNLEWLEKGFGPPYLEDLVRIEKQSAAVAQEAAASAAVPAEYLDPELMERCMAAVHRARTDDTAPPKARIRLACMLYDLFRHAKDSSVDVMAAYINSRV